MVRLENNRLLFGADGLVAFLFGLCGQQFYPDTCRVRKGITARPHFCSGYLRGFCAQVVHNDIICPGCYVDESALGRKEIFRHEFVAYGVIKADAHEFRFFADNDVAQGGTGVKVQKRRHRGIQGLIDRDTEINASTPLVHWDTLTTRSQHKQKYDQNEAVMLQGFHRPLPFLLI